MDVAIELCAERVSEKTDVCDEEADDARDGSYGP
jgi:hypothetical protein